MPTSPKKLDTEMMMIDQNDLITHDSRRAMYVELTKARLSGLVVITAAVGYLLGNPHGVNVIDAITTMLSAAIGADWARLNDTFMLAIASVDWIALAAVLLGVGLAAGGTSAINQWMEVDRDRAMHRTCDRPLPSGGMALREAMAAGVAMIVIGSGVLFLATNALAGWLTLLTAAIYIFIYTPMKTRSTLNTLVGAVCGALPPMIGWAAASGGLGFGAWLLGTILFIWQLPHFLALAWMYRADYERGGFRMLPMIDRSGLLTSHIVLVTSLLLIPLVLISTLGGLTGLFSAVLASVLGIIFAIAGVRMYRERSIARAKAVFLASIAWLPLVLGAMVLDQQRTDVDDLIQEEDVKSRLFIQHEGAPLADAPDAVVTR